MPSAPELKTVVLSDVNETLRILVCRLNGETCFVQYVNKSPEGIRVLGAEKVLSLGDDAFLKASHSTLVSRRRLTLNGYPGHEIVMTRRRGSREACRIYLVGSRCYTLICVEPPRQPTVGLTDADKFFNSFALLPPLPKVK